MKREVVERLAIDSAAGELTEDGQSLFEAYLAEHAEAKQWANAMRQVYQQTHTAINSKTEASGANIAAVCVMRGRPALTRWRPALRWAAIVCVAALLGAGAGRWSKAPVVPERPELAEVAQARPAAAASLDSKDAAGSFWRAKALAMFEPRPYRERTAAMQAGGLRRKYEHYIKEKYHE